MTNIDQLMQQVGMPAPPAHQPTPPGPFMVDVTVTLPSGGRITLAGRDLSRHGLNELFSLINEAVGLGDAG